MPGPDYQPFITLHKTQFNSPEDFKAVISFEIWEQPADVACSIIDLTAGIEFAKKPVLVKRYWNGAYGRYDVISSEFAGRKGTKYMVLAHYLGKSDSKTFEYYL